MSTGLILDILIICLLAASTGYCFVLNRRLAWLRRGQEEFLKMIDRFDDATRRAETNIGRLRDVGAGIAESLDERIATARGLRDELNFLVEDAAPAVERSMASAAPSTMAVSGAVSGAFSGAFSGASPGGRPDETTRSVVESGLLEALREARKG